MLYFVRPEDDLELRPIVSGVLQRLGYDKVTDGSAIGVTAGEWVKARVRKGVGKGKPRKEVAEEEIIDGIKAKFYD